MHFTSERLTLEQITPELARRILVRDEQAGDAWHPEYPFADELGPLEHLAQSEATDSVFSMYLIREDRSGLAIGGLGFFGPPDDHGCVEFGYGLVESARGKGYATEAVSAALEFARATGARYAKADTAPDNLPSQRVLEKAGLKLVEKSGSAFYYAREL